MLRPPLHLRRAPAELLEGAAHLVPVPVRRFRMKGSVDDDGDRQLARPALGLTAEAEEPVDRALGDEAHRGERRR
eukprot:10041849-Alexandrium_andersonii.AAC.1